MLESKLRELPQRRFKLIAVGGTFDCLHRGHEALLREALSLGEKVVLGLTSDEFVKRLRKTHPVQGYEERRSALKAFFERVKASDRVDIMPLMDPYGAAVERPDIEALVVSRETEARGHELNELRKKRGLRPLTVIVVPTVLGANGKPISSTAIRRGLIKSDGTVAKAAE